jgi:uncharacterized SAM-binding protein YcdF (DUF218 family)
VSTRTETRTPQPAPTRRSPLRRVVGAGLVVLLVLLVVVPLLAVGRVVQAATTDDRTPTDAVIVLGAAQFWGRPSPVLEARLTHARDLLDDDVAPRIITVGGKQSGDITTEAQAGKQWLVDAGVPGRSVVAVAEGRDTLSSLTAAAELMARRGWTSATIVTDPAHTARSLDMARAVGIDAHGSPSQSGDGSRLTVDYVLREAGGLLWFWISERRDVDAVAGP